MCSVCDKILPRVYLLFLVPWIWVLFVFAVIPILTLPDFCAYAQRRWEAMNKYEDTPVTGGIRFIRYYANGGPAVIFSQLQGVYYAETGLGAGLPRSGCHDLYFNADESRLLAELRSGKVPHVFMDETFPVAGFEELNYEKIAELPEAGLVYYRLKGYSSRQEKLSDWFPLQPHLNISL